MTYNQVAIKDAQIGLDDDAQTFEENSLLLKMKPLLGIKLKVAVQKTLILIYFEMY